MSRNKLMIIVCACLFLNAFLLPATSLQTFARPEDQDELALRYQTFIEETRMIMTETERKVFLGLKTNRGRNRFMTRFWNSRGGRLNALRENISVLMFLRLVQALDLKEDQAAVILPNLNRIEKEKLETSRKLRKSLNVLRQDLNKDKFDEQDLIEKAEAIQELKRSIQAKDEELEKIIADNVSPVQWAKFIVFSQDFYRGLREKLYQARSLRGNIRRK